MRQGQQNRRGRGRNNNQSHGSSHGNTHGGGNTSNSGNRRGQSPLSRSYESNGPSVKIRGNAAHVAEKYMSLARDALTSGDNIMAENFLQHAEHYNRIIMSAQQPADGAQTGGMGQRPRTAPAEFGSMDDDDGDGDDQSPLGAPGLAQGSFGQGMAQHGQGGGGGQAANGTHSHNPQQPSQQPSHQHAQGQPQPGRNGYGQRHDGQRSDGQRSDTNRNEGQRADGQRGDGRRNDQNRGDGQRADRYPRERDGRDRDNIRQRDDGRQRPSQPQDGRPEPRYADQQAPEARQHEARQHEQPRREPARRDDFGRQPQPSVDHPPVASEGYAPATVPSFVPQSMTAAPIVADGDKNHGGEAAGANQLPPSVAQDVEPGIYRRERAPRAAAVPSVAGQEGFRPVRRRRPPAATDQMTGQTDAPVGGRDAASSGPPDAEGAAPARRKPDSDPSDA